jgi:hypothetical protein
MTHKYAQVNPIITGWNKKTVIKITKNSSRKTAKPGCHWMLY